MKNRIKIFVFLVVIFIFFIFFQRISKPIWNYPDYVDSVDDVITEFKELPNNCIQILFLGTSHVGYGVSPMDLYRQYGITSYNMGTSDQGLDSSLLVLCEVFKTQKPKIVFLDISKIDNKSINANDRNKIRDNIPTDRNKLRFILSNGNGKSIRENIRFLPEYWNKLIPFYEYHSRWKNLSDNEFSRFSKKSLFLMGYNIFSASLPFSAWNEDNRKPEDIIANEMKNINIIKTYSYSNNVYNEYIDYENPLYTSEVTKESYLYLNAIKDVCAKNGSKLILTKIPSAGYPNFYEPCWTIDKHIMALNFAKELNLPFIDFKYDIESGLNLHEDTVDSGGHLNLNGARKVTKVIGEWISNNYTIHSTYNNSIMNEKLKSYNELEQLCDLQLESKFSEYFKKLKEYNHNLVIFCSLTDAGLSCLNDNEKKAFSDFGFKTNFENVNFRDSFIAVIDSGIVKYECISNREQEYSYLIDKKHYAKLRSSGWYTDSISHIDINETDYILNQRGLNIVVYDKDSKMVIDSVNFDFLNGENRTAHRDNGKTNEYKFNYQYYLYAHPEVVNKNIKNEGGL